MRGRAVWVENGLPRGDGGSGVGMTAGQRTTTHLFTFCLLLFCCFFHAFTQTHTLPSSFSFLACFTFFFHSFSFWVLTLLRASPLGPPGTHMDGRTDDDDGTYSFWKAWWPQLTPFLLFLSFQT